MCVIKQIYIGKTVGDSILLSLNLESTNKVILEQQFQQVNLLYMS